MTVARFFDRIYAAAGRQLTVSREALERTLEGTLVAVRVRSPETQADTWTAQLLVNLLARLYPRLSIHASSACRDALADLARSIHSGIDLTEDPTSAAIEIAIGEVSEGGLPRVTVGSAGWCVRVAPGAAPHKFAGPPNPYSAAAAAALGAAAVFQRVFLNQALVTRPTTVSLLDFSERGGIQRKLAATTAERTLFVGLGAVGNAALWALSRHDGLRLDAVLVDDESVELSNLQRYVLARDADVGLQKTVLAARSLDSRLVSAELQAKRFEDLEESLIASAPNVMVSVDNIPTRRAVQATLPRLVINGWTSESGLGASRHRFDGETGCLACLYQPQGASPSQTELAAAALGLPHERAALLWVTAQPLTQGDVDTISRHLSVGDALKPWIGKRIQDIYSDVVCGMVAVDLPAVGRIEAVPLAHQSVLAGVLAAAELIKQSSPELKRRAQPDTLIAWHDVKRPIPSRWTQPVARAQGCICGDEVYQEAYRDKWRQHGATRTSS